MSLLKSKTVNFRHSLVRLIAPNVYNSFLFHESGRPTIPLFQQYFGKNPVVGAEIGVNEALNAKNLLSTLNIQQLYLVDSYEPCNIVSKESAEETLLIAQRNVSAFPQAKFNITTSVEASKSLPDNLDFVYIDADHAYESAKQDIALWYPKVKPKGVLVGHDFTELFPGVVKATIEFAFFNGLKLHFLSPDWWIIKPEDSKCYSCVNADSKAGCFNEFQGRVCSYKPDSKTAICSKAKEVSQ